MITYAKLNMMKLIPHPNKVFIRIYKKDRHNLFNKIIEREDGSTVELAIGHEWDDERLDASYAQNVSIGEVVGVGNNLSDRILVGDIAIIDYLVDNDKLSFVEETEEYKTLAVWAKCSYHQFDAPKEANGRRGFYKGEYKRIGQVFGVVRENKLIAIEPYLFLEHESNVVNVYSKKFFHYEETIAVVERKVLASFPGAYAQEGEIIVIPDTDIFDRVLEEKTISTIFNNDIKIKKQHV